MSAAASASRPLKLPAPTPRKRRGSAASGASNVAQKLLST